MVGGGGREHALCWSLGRSARVDRILVAPGNAGTALEERCENLPVGAGDVSGLVDVARREAVDLVVVGPEAPLAEGLADALEAVGVPTFGPSAACARLEASKAYCKAFLDGLSIPTALLRRVSRGGARAVPISTGSPPSRSSRRAGWRPARGDSRRDTR